MENIVYLVDDVARSSSRRIDRQLDMLPYNNNQHMPQARQMESGRCVASHNLFTEQATFTRDGFINSRNSHLRSDEIPQANLKLICSINFR